MNEAFRGTDPNNPPDFEFSIFKNDHQENGPWYAAYTNSSDTDRGFCPVSWGEWQHSNF